MCHRAVLDATFRAFLLRIDEELAAETRAGGCRRCGAALHHPTQDVGRQPPCLCARRDRNIVDTADPSSPPGPVVGVGPREKEFYEACSGAIHDPWRQSEVLWEPRVQLIFGLDCTNGKTDLGADGAA